MNGLTYTNHPILSFTNLPTEETKNFQCNGVRLGQKFVRSNGAVILIYNKRSS